MIEWTGLYANTPYSSANNKTQDDAVVGMQDTVYATGPGYGVYRATVRIHNESGAVVAEIPLSSGGGPLSAPAPVRILDDGTVYGYSLQVNEGKIPPDDAAGVVVRIVGGASKRFPGAGFTPSSDGSTLVSQEPIVAPTVRGRPGNVGGSRLWHGTTLAEQSNGTVITRHQAWGDYKGFKLWHSNFFLSQAITITKSIAAADGDPANNGSALTWIPQYTIDPTTGTENAAASVPAALSGTQGQPDVVPKLVSRDPCMLQSVARTDTAGKLPVLFTRDYIAGTFLPTNPSTADNTALNSTLGTDWHSFLVAGDHVSTPDAQPWPTSANPKYNVSFPEFFYTKPTVSMLIIGDSTMAGFGTTSHGYSPGHEAARLAYVNAAPFVISPMMFAIAASKSHNTLNMLAAVLASGIHIDVVLMRCVTANDASYGGDWTNQRSVPMYLRMVDMCKAAGIEVIMTNMLPSKQQATPDNVSNRAAMTKTRDTVAAIAAAKKITLVDSTPYLGDMSLLGGYPNFGWLPAYNYANDGIHGNDAATAIEGQLVYSAVKSMWGW